MHGLNISPKVWTVFTRFTHVFVGAITTEIFLHHQTNLKVLLASGASAVGILVFRWANPADNFPAPSAGLVAADKVVMAPTTTP